MKFNELVINPDMKSLQIFMELEIIDKKKLYTSDHFVPIIDVSQLINTLIHNDNCNFHKHVGILFK